MPRESRECGHYPGEGSLISWRKRKEEIDKSSNLAQDKQSTRSDTVVGKRKCDAQASVRLRLFLHCGGLYNTSLQQHISLPYEVYCIYWLDPPSRVSIEIIAQATVGLSEQVKKNYEYRLLGSNRLS